MSRRRVPNNVVVLASAVQYSVCDLLGSGGFGEVYKAKYNGNTVAFKVPLEKANIPANKKRLVEKEAEKLKASTDHQYIVTLFGVVLDFNIQGLILEYMLFGSCSDFIQEYGEYVDETMRLKFVENIVCAMTWLHSMDPPIRHLDLKADNVLINNLFDAKLSDFGLSEWKTATTTRSLVDGPKNRNGTLTHVPPEVFRNITKKGSVEEDVYAFGITAWEIFTGLKPYKDCSADMIRTAVLEGQRPDINIVTQNCSTNSRFIRDMIRLSWEHNPDHRPRFSELYDKIKPVYNRAMPQLGKSVEKLRQGILEEHGVESEKYQSTRPFNDMLNVHHRERDMIREPVESPGVSVLQNNAIKQGASGLQTPGGNHGGLVLNTPVRKQVNGRLKPYMTLHRDGSDLESTPRQDGLETNIENQFSELSLMSPDAGASSPEEDIRREADGTDNVFYNNDNFEGHSGVVSLKSKRYIPGHELQHPKGIVGHPSSVEPLLSGLHGGAREPEGAEKQTAAGHPSAVEPLLSGLHGGAREPEGAEKQTAAGHPSAVEPLLNGLHGGTRESKRAEKQTADDNGLVNDFVRQLSDSNPDIAESLINNEDAMNNLTRSLNSRSSLTSPTILEPETRPQLLTIHGTENAVTTNNQRNQTNLGNTGGIISADQLRTTFENANDCPPTSLAATQPVVTSGNQASIAIAPPNLYARDETNQRPRYADPGTELQNLQPGTFNRYQTPMVNLPTSNNRHLLGDGSFIQPQVNRPTNMQARMNTRTPVNQQPPLASNTRLPFYQPAAQTSRQRSNGDRPAEETRGTSSSQRSTSKGQEHSQASNGPILISHEHSDGAKTTISFRDGVKYPPNLQIGKNMVMNINHGTGPSVHHGDLPRRRSQECDISSLTTNENVPELETLDMVCVEIGNDWKRLCRQLNISEPEIEQLQYDHFTAGLYEIIYQGLRMWKQRNGSSATIQKLARALWEIDRSDIAKKLR